MEPTTVVVALVGALGPTLAALAAWRAAAGTRKEVTTNNGRRAGEWIETIGRVATDVHVLRIESASKHSQLQQELEALRNDFRAHTVEELALNHARIAELEIRLEAMERPRRTGR